MSKKILAAAIMALMLLVIAFPASAQRQVTQVEVRGTVADAGATPDEQPTWSAQTFAGFYYDIKNNLSTETLNISDTLADLQTTRTIPEKTLFYRTGKAPVQFKANEKEGVTVDGDANYQVVGWMAEKWVAVKGVANKIAKLAFEMEKDDKKTLTTGETWALGSGYEITINAVDARASPRQVWFTLKKDGAVVDEGIGQSPASGSVEDKQKAVYFKKLTILGESDSLLIALYVDSIFSGATSDMVQFKYGWLIDQSTAMEVSGSDTFGVYEVTEATSERMVLWNKNSVSLSKNTDTTLVGNMKFRIADNDTLRFYPMVLYTDPGTYEVRGTVADAGATPDAQPYWNAQTFAGFWYDIKNNLSTETLNISDTLADLQTTRTIPEKTLFYRTGKAPVQFKANEKEGVTVDGDANYQVVGWMAEKWVAVKGVANKIAKLAFEMEKDDKKTLTTGETWALGSGYEITINAVDARASPRQVWFTLKKDGAVVDEGIGQSPASGSVEDKQKAVYFKKLTILGESDSLLIALYVDSIFSGATSDMVQFKYAWLIDQSTAMEVSGSDTFGVYEVTEATSERMVLWNKNSVSLSKNTDTTLVGDMKFTIADNDTLRFYPAVGYTIGAGPSANETGGPNVTPMGTVKPTANVTGRPNVTAVTTGTAVPTAVESPTVTEGGTPAPVATTPKEPGFEAVFAIAGLLAVAYIVLRQRK